MCKAPMKGMRHAPALALLFLLIACIAPAYANTVTFSDYGLTNQKIDVYNATAFIGEYNSTDTVTMTDTDNYVFVFKPAVTTNFFSDPFAFVRLVTAWLPNIIVILIAVFIGVGIVAIIKKVL